MEVDRWVGACLRVAYALLTWGALQCLAVVTRVVVCTLLAAWMMNARDHLTNSRDHFAYGFDILVKVKVTWSR